VTDLTMYGLVSARADDPAVGLRADDLSMSWADVVRAAEQRARWMATCGANGGKDVPHVGVLLDNVPEYAFLLLGAALSGAVVVGLNPVRTGAALRRDVEHTACDVVVSAGSHLDALHAAGVEVPVLDVVSSVWTGALVDAEAADVRHPGADPTDPSRPYVLILTSGTTSAPKAVVCSTGKIASQGSVIPHLVQLSADDTTYVAMPLFHSNAIIAGFAPTLAVGATLALAPRFSASSFIDDVRRYGATYANYVGTPLSYVLAQPERGDDADNPLRVLFGNEAAPADIRRFAERFGCQVIDAYGSTEGGISILRTDETPPAALGVGIGDIAVLHPDGRECAVAEFDGNGRLTNPDEAIGELVNRDGAGAFEGYWDNDDAVTERLAGGHYHSGDLGYRDADGFLYFAGRMNDWVRVGGENFGVAPIQRVLADHPDVIEAVVLGVPDAVAGDQILAVVVAPHGLDVGAFATWMDGREDLAERWVPRYLRVVDDVPRTGTGKVQRERMRLQAWVPDGTLVRDGRGYRRMTGADRMALHEAFARAGREHVLPWGAAEGLSQGMSVTTGVRP
jgi:fatty-acyl-CoA synthase